jgi:hypothetical protein
MTRCSLVIQDEDPYQPSTSRNQSQVLLMSCVKYTGAFSLRRTPAGCRPPCRMAFSCPSAPCCLSEVEPGMWRNRTWSLRADDGIPRTTDEKPGRTRPGSHTVLTADVDELLLRPSAGRKTRGRFFSCEYSPQRICARTRISVKLPLPAARNRAAVSSGSRRSGSPRCTPPHVQL